MDTVPGDILPTYMILPTYGITYVWHYLLLILPAYDIPLRMILPSYDITYKKWNCGVSWREVGHTICHTAAVQQEELLFSLYPELVLIHYGHEYN